MRSKLSFLKLLILLLIPIAAFIFSVKSVSAAAGGGMAIDCDATAAGIQNNCTYNSGQTFNIQVHVSESPVFGYDGIQAKIRWSPAFVNYQPLQGEGRNICAGSPPRFIEPGGSKVLFGCIRFGATFVGPVFQLQFQCLPGVTGSARVDLLSGGSGDSFFLDGASIINPATTTFSGASINCETSGSNLNVPYFNQTDSPWGPQEYDHANSMGPFFCGSTITQCGCALTSAAMLLKYYGVDKSPTGEPTTPGSLNNWLKANSGYAFGSIKWTSVGTYSLKANQNFGTQKIKFNGYGNGQNDFDTLNQDLNQDKPVILEEANHFIVATGIQESTYSINDPRWQDKSTLESYGNQFRNMRRYEKTSTDLSTIYISTPTPTELFLTDRLGRRVGKDPITGIVYNEIPNSFYILEPTLIDDSVDNSSTPPDNSGVTTLVIINPTEGNFDVKTFNFTENYAINFSGYDRNGDINQKEFIQMTSANGTQVYDLNYSPESDSQFEVSQIVDIDIKPDTDQDPINPWSKGVLPVAVLTTPNFDATAINVSTIEFGSGKSKEEHEKGHLKDIDNDGDIDLVLHFKTQDIGIQIEDTEICLTGMTINSTHIKGCDSILIVPK